MRMLIETEMNNRVAFIDFVRGLLNINPLERWTPQQAKLHPFITQAKFTQPFVPPMNLKNASGKPPPPGVQQQQQAEALSKQRAAQAAQAAQAQAAAAAASQSAYAMQMNQYPQQPYAQQPPAYGNMHGAPPQGAPPPYPATNYAPMGMVNQQAQMGASHYGAPQSLYAQATLRAGRQRAATMDQSQGGIPAAIQRVASHLDPNQPIRLQPSPAYYPPPADVYMDSPSSSRRRNSRNQRNRDFIRTLEDGAMQQWH